MLDAAELAAGVIGGAGANQLDKLIERFKGEELANSKKFHAILEEMRDSLRLVADRLSPVISPPDNMPVVLNQYPLSFQLPHYHRAHFCIFIPSGPAGSAGAYEPKLSSVALYFEIPGAGMHIRNLAPGWTQLDYPPQTLISTADGNSYPVIMSFRDDALNDNLIPAISSAVTPAATNPAQTAAAGADTSFTWNEVVNHVSIQNNTAASVFYAFDQSSVTAADAIYVLAAGQAAFWDRKCTVLHVSSAAQQNFGGQSGITIEGFV